MANFTENFRLEKPINEEFYNVKIQNENMDKIDAQLKTLSDGIEEYRYESKKEAEIFEVSTKIRTIPKGVLTTGIQTIMPVTGTATVESVLDDSTFCSGNGVSLTGTMTNRGAVSTTLTTQSQAYTVPKGYHDGNGVVKANITNLTGSNIKKGVAVGGIVGTALSVKEWTLRIVTSSSISRSSNYGEASIIISDAVGVVYSKTTSSTDTILYSEGTYNYAVKGTVFLSFSNKTASNAINYLGYSKNKTSGLLTAYSVANNSTSGLKNYYDTNNSVTSYISTAFTALLIVPSESASIEIFNRIHYSS